MLVNLFAPMQAGKTVYCTLLLFYAMHMLYYVILYMGLVFSVYNAWAALCEVNTQTIIIISICPGLLIVSPAKVWGKLSIFRPTGHPGGPGVAGRDQCGGRVVVQCMGARGKQAATSGVYYQGIHARGGGGGGGGAWASIRIRPCWGGGGGTHWDCVFFPHCSAASLESRASPEKGDGGPGGGGDSDTFFSFLKILGQFSRHGVGVSSYITNLSNLYNKQASKQATTKKVHAHSAGELTWKKGPHINE